MMMALPSSPMAHTPPRRFRRLLARTRTWFVCGARRDSVRIGRYHYTHRPYVGMDMLAAQIAERRAELAFLRSTWPRRLTQPTGVASEMAIPTAATLADSPSPDVAVAAADGATDDTMAEGPETGTMGAWRQPFLLMSPSPPSPTVVQHELLACTFPPSQTVVPLPRPAHPIRDWCRPSLLVSPSPPSPTVV